LANVRTEGDVLDRVTVRLLREEERSQFNYYLQEQHYLESSTLVGEWLRYVAEVDGQWVALMTFSAPALHLKARERWIGWSPRQRARRLGLIVNNSRFLSLPERQRYPNLASRVLQGSAGSERRLAERWGHPVLAVESFVDESQYRGTCYRACGFEAVGATEGFGRASRDFYQEHGQPKQLYLRDTVPVPANGYVRLAYRRNWLPMKLIWLVCARSEHPPWKTCWIAWAVCPIHATAMGCVIANGLSWPAPLSLR
jgi:hypothetical protein